MTDKKAVKNEHVVACSGGKDSVATILTALKYNEPLDEVVWVEVMFDKETSGEVPEHRNFVYGSLKPFCENNGVKFTVLHSPKTYDDVFHHIFTRGKNTGGKHGFTWPRRCAVNRDCKLKAINEYKRREKSRLVFYVGIAADEKKRLKRLSKTNNTSLLEKYNLTEIDAFNLCKKNNLLSPVYNLTKRNGCWFCPNAKDSELLHLLNYHVDLFDKLIEWENEKNVVNKLFNLKETPTEIKARLLSANRTQEIKAS